MPLKPKTIKHEIDSIKAEQLGLQRTLSEEQLRIKLIDFTHEQHGTQAAANAMRLPTWQLVEMFEREYKAGGLL